MKGLFVTVLVGSFLWSCTLNEDDYKIESLTVSPEIAIPLATGNVSVQDILDETDSAYVKVYPDGLVYLYYDDTLTSQDIRDLIDVPNLGNINRSLSFPAGTYNASANDVESSVSNTTVDMNINPEKLTEIAFKSGELNFSMALAPPNNNASFAVKIEIPEFIKDSDGSTLRQTVSGSGNISLIGYTFKSAVANKFTLKLTLIIKQHNNSYTIAAGSNVNVTVNYTNTDFRYIKGFFGDQTANPSPRTLEIGTFGTFLEEGTVSFAQPKMQFQVINEYGVPLKVSFSTLQARKEGSSINVLINPSSPVTINQPATLGSTATTNVAVTNVNQVFNFGPSEFYYQVSGRINGGLTSGNNFMADTSKVRIRLNIELPLYGKASDIQLADTTELELGDVDASQIESAQLKVLITNQLPLDGSLQLSLLDENEVLIENILSAAQQHIVVGSTVNATGDLQSAGIYDDFIDLDKDKLNKIFAAKKLVISIILNTSKDNSGSKVDVKFKSDMKADVKLGLKAKLKATVKL